MSSAPPNFEQALAAARAAAAAVAASRASATQVDHAEAAASAELRLAEAHASTLTAAPSAANFATAKLKRPALPVDACREDILGLVAANQVVVITGDTGSGKSTQLAQFLHQAGYAKGGAIAITQPRRVGAVSVSRRVAQEMGVKLGEEVGYSIRFEDCTSRSTVIKFMTDGCLLREAIEHKNLEQYNVIVLDEAHERSLQTDILFGLVRDIISRRPTLKFIITSATLDARQFSKFFFDCPTYHVPGRCHPVEIFYSPKVESKYYVEKAVEYAARIHSTLPLGDILVFLTGEEEIVRACKLLGAKVDSMCDEGIEMPDIVILPVYAALAPQQQQAVFAKVPPNCRKVLVSTNICETSLTVDGIVYVIDSGFVKQRVFNPDSGIDSLLVVPISQVQATQRTGRAGRTQPGQSYRLYTEHAFAEEMPKSTLPEIQRANLANTVLLLKEFGVDDVLNFAFLDAPAPSLIVGALQQLYWLDALDEHGRITAVGSRLAALPLEPALGRMLLHAIDLGCVAEMLSVAAMTTVENLHERPAQKDEAELAELKHKLFFSEFGDHITLLCIFDSWMDAGCSPRWCEEHYFQSRALEKAKSIRGQLEDLLKKSNAPIVSTARPDKVVRLCCKVVAKCFFHHAARLTDQPGRYKTLHGANSSMAYVHPASPLALTNPKWVTYSELVYTNKPCMRHVCAIEYDWIEHLVPRLQSADPRRLTGHALRPAPALPSASSSSSSFAAAASLDAAAAASAEPNQSTSAAPSAAASVLGKRSSDDAVLAARQRYLDRKKSSS